MTAPKESLKTRLFRLGTNFFPCYRGTGGRVTFIAEDFRCIRIRLPLSWRTRNVVGTIFGGSIYAATDPFYMLMLRMRLGKSYVIWDKAASVQFIRPGKSTLYAEFVLTAAEEAEILRLLKQQPSVDRVYTVELCDKNGVVHAIVQKVVYITTKKAYAEKQKQRQKAA